MPAGRPTKYDPAFCQVVIDEMAKGLSKEAVAGHLRISKQTLYNWAEEHSEFLDAINEGELASLYFWEKLGVMGAAGKVVNFNATAWVFNMKNRAGWRDKIEQTGETIHTHRVETYLPDNGKTEPDGD